MQEQLEAEMAARQAVRQQQILSEVDKYKALITQRINGAMFKDETMRNKVVVYLQKLA